MLQATGCTCFFKVFSFFGIIDSRTCSGDGSSSGIDSPCGDRDGKKSSLVSLRGDADMVFLPHGDGDGDGEARPNGEFPIAIFS